MNTAQFLGAFPHGAAIAKLTALLAGALLGASCAQPALSGGVVVYIGGAMGNACDPNSVYQGCSAGQRVQCDVATAKWTLLGQCDPGQYCVEKAESGNPKPLYRIASCAGTTATDTQSTAVTDGAGGDAQLDAGSTDAISDADSAGTKSDLGSTDGSAGPDILAEVSPPVDTSSPECGNGTCEKGESSATCANDCPPAGPICGNGTCEKGETTSNCSQDCPAPAGHPCNTACGGKAPTGCYCDAACLKSGSCCNSQGGAAANCAGSTCSECNTSGPQPVAKGCTGSSDQAFLGGLADEVKLQNFKGALSDCTLKKGCLGKANATAKVMCIAACMDMAYEASGLTKSCSACYGLTGYCAAGPCLAKCIDSSSVGCSECVAANCDPYTNACKAGTCDPYAANNCGVTK